MAKNTKKEKSNTETKNITKTNDVNEKEKRKIEIEKLEKNIEDKKKKLENKKYLITLDSSGLKTLIDFITTKASWTYEEGLGLIKAHKNIIDAKKQATQNSIKNGIMLDAITIKVIHFFYSKYTSIGLSDAKQQMQVLEQIVKALEPHEKEVKEINEMEFKLASVREGLEYSVPETKK